MKIEKLGSVYQNGERVESQRVIYKKSDDLYAFTELQRRYENICTQISETQNPHDVLYLQSEKSRLETEIAAQQVNINGYESE
jgi:hypothetical protein